MVNTPGVCSGTLGSFEGTLQGIGPEVTLIKPSLDSEAGLKDDFVFRLTQLGPYDPFALAQEPKQFLSKLSTETTFKRLSAFALSTKVQQLGSNLFIATSATEDVDFIQGDIGLIKATTLQIQSELDRATSLINSKRNEVSSLLLLRRTPSGTTFVPDKMSTAKKGEVLDICDQSAGFPYLFIGRPRFSQTIDVINGDQLVMDNVSIFNGEPELTLVTIDEALTSNVPTFHFLNVVKVITPGIGDLIEIKYIARDPEVIVSPLEVRIANRIITVNFDRSKVLTVSSVLSALNNVPSIKELLNIELIGNSTTVISNPTDVVIQGTQVVIFEVASLASPVTTQLSGANNDLTFTANSSVKGENIGIKYVVKDPAEISGIVEVNVSSELQSVSIPDSVNEGSIVFGVEEVFTITNADTSSVVQSEMQKLLGLEDTTVSGNFISGFTISYVGSDGLKDQQSLVVLSNTLFANTTVTGMVDVIQDGYDGFSFFDEVQEVTFSNTPDAGEFQLNFGGDLTSTLEYNVTALQMQNALRALPTLSEVNVFGTVSTGFIITFAGADGLQDQPTLIVVNSTLTSQEEIATTITTTQPGSGIQNEIQTLTFAPSITPEGGKLILGYRQLTNAMNYSASINDVQVELRALSGLESVEVTGTGIAGGFIVDFSDGIGEGQNYPQLFAQSNSLKVVTPISVDVSTVANGSGTQNEHQRIIFSDTPNRGTFTLTYKQGVNSYTTAPIAYNASAGTIEEALNALTPLSEVNVIKELTPLRLDIQFIGVDGLQPHEQLEIDISNLDIANAVTIEVDTLLNGGVVEVSINRVSPPTALAVKAALEAHSLVGASISVVVAEGDGSGLIIKSQEASSAVIFDKTVPRIGTLEDNYGLAFTLHPSTVKVEATPIVTSPSVHSLPSTQSIEIIRSTGAFYSVTGYPVLREKFVKDSAVELNAFCTLIKSEVPLTNLFASTSPLPTTDTKFVGNLDISSLVVELHDNDATVLLIKNGEAQPGASVQYKLHTESDEELGIDKGNVDVTVKLFSISAPLPVKTGQELFKGQQAVALGVRIATTPDRIKKATFKDVADAAGKIFKPNESTKFEEEDTDPQEFYFNFQANIGGQQTNLSKYGVLRLFDSVEFKYQNNTGTLISFHKTTIAGIDAENNTILLKDPISTLPPDSILNSIRIGKLPAPLVIVPQTPLNPGRTYRIRITFQDRCGVPQPQTNASTQQQIDVTQLSPQGQLSPTPGNLAISTS